MGTLPSGTVTFLFTDIEGSTRLAQQHPDSVAALLERHHAILKQSIEAHGGYIFQIIGDAFCAAFQTVREALEGALDAQLSLGAENWSPEPIRVRMGISTGSAQIRYQEDRPSDYSGYLSLAHVQRVMSVAHGGQILLANASVELVRGELPPNVNLRDLGEHRLKSLLNPEHLWQAVAPNLQAEFPPLASLNSIPNNLPLQLTSFIGRERELEEVQTLLENHRLITLTGSGGTGKTRLSLQVAAEVLDQFHDGVWLVELTPLSNPALIGPAVLRVLGLVQGQEREPLEILTDYLADKALLIILDSCEHLLDACCRVIQALLQAAPSVRVMATSREGLNLAGEQAYRVPSLAAPGLNDLPPIEQLLQYEAVHLFVERATLMWPGFVASNNNAPAIAELCRRLDGIPLAIELAAARTRSMPLAAIVSRLDDRFRLLTGGSRTALPRQQTLQATIDWSYALLSEPERLLLQRLSVFRGGSTLEAAEVACAGKGVEQVDIVDLMSRLADKSLLSLEEHGRYDMLETLRHYAGDKLAQSGHMDWARDQHLKYMLTLAEQAEPEVRGPNQQLWLDRLGAELDNLREASEWAKTRDPELFLRLASALWRFWDIRVGNSELMDWLRSALALTADKKTVARARALARMSYLSTNFGNNEEGRQFAQSAYELAHALQDRLSMALALSTLGVSAIYLGSQAAASYLSDALTLSREIGEPGLAARALGHLAMDAKKRNDLPSAIALFDEALQEARLSGDNRLLTWGFSFRASISVANGEIAEARELLQQAWQAAEATDDKGGIEDILEASAQLALVQEDYGRAEQDLEKAYRVTVSLGIKSQIHPLLMELGIVDWAAGRISQFYEREEQALALAQQTGPRARAAFVLYYLGEACRLRGMDAAAWDKYSQALTIFRQHNTKDGYCHCLQAIGALALSRGQINRAVRLFAARTKLRAGIFAEDFYPFMVREREKQIAEARAQLGEEAFDRAWAEGQAMGEEEMLAYALVNRTED